VSDAPEAVLARGPSTDEGTLGTLTVGDGAADALTVHTIEPPWRDNARGVSCIPAGAYLCRWRRSPRYGHTYHVTAVPGRSYILIHSGNLAGDVAQGLRAHSKGCILPGLRRGRLLGQRAVLASKAALRALHERLGGREFWLRVTTAPTPAAC